MTDPGYSGDMNYGGGYGYQPPADPKLKQRGTIALGLSIRPSLLVTSRPPSTPSTP